MNGFSANSGRSSRSLWQETIFELRRAGSLLPIDLGQADETSVPSTAGVPTYHDGVAMRSSGSPVRAALSALDTFSHVLTQIDRLTHAHSERVARYAVRLAHFVDVSPDDMKRLQLGALLHDCGKIEIDPCILNKAGSLTPDEYSEIKQHPLHGVRILRSVPALQAAIPTVLHHHERFDGKGYPACLRGEEIPLTARIVGIADAYDAMISDRPYRRGLSRRLARETLCACRGSQFDPQLVEVFVDGLNVGSEELF